MAQHSAVLVRPEVSTDRQYMPPSFAVMNAELMSGRLSQLSHPSDT